MTLVLEPSPAAHRCMSAGSWSKSGGNTQIHNSMLSYGMWEYQPAGHLSLTCRYFKIKQKDQSIYSSLLYGIYKRVIQKVSERTTYIISVSKISKSTQTFLITLIFYECFEYSFRTRSSKFCAPKTMCLSVPFH